MAKYKLTLQPDPDPTDEAGIRRLRWILKQLLRNHRCRCLRIEQVKEPDDDDRLIDRALLADGENMTL
jgi:hypothetical protein